MKKFLSVVLFVIEICVMPLWASDETRRATAEELLNVMEVRQSVEQSFALIKQMLPGQVEKMTTATGETNISSSLSSKTVEMMDVMFSEMSWDKMKEQYIDLYAQTFTEDEMKGIIAFYKSPAGQSFIKKQPELMKKSMEMSQKMMSKLVPKIQEMTRQMNSGEQAQPKN